ncbi:MAG: type II/IV secretion system protein [Deltaproteobacteria bacterium]|nr:type II/IV secretion system protein [Deltaproteobacteria bacterium]
MGGPPSGLGVAPGKPGGTRGGGKPGLRSRTRADFSVQFVLQALSVYNLINPDQLREVRIKEATVRSRISKERGGEGRRYDVSPVEIVSDFNFPVPGRPGLFLDQDKISEICALQCGAKYQKIDPLNLDMGLITRTLSRPYASKHAALPLERVDGVLRVAVANPFDDELFDNLRTIVSQPIEPVLSSKADILRAVDHVYGFKKSMAAAADEHGGPTVDLSNFEQLVRLSTDRELDANDKPVVAAVEYLLRYAFDQRASDIHIEPRRDESIVRMRIDGVLHPVHTMPKPVHAPVVSRIKMMSRLDIAEKRRPQDGRIKTDKDGREIEMRVSTLPTAFGEKVVMRIFDTEALIQDLAQVGFLPEELQMFEGWIERPHGLLLVTGPTGSGKTTTLYSALRVLAGPDVNVVTIEDPIEMVHEAFNQVQVQPRIELDFAAALRHILRQDPDIIMVGEIRDGETARYAIQAALTGHLVLSTLHTNDACDALSRLVDLGVERFLVAGSVVGVMAQRLVRQVCPHCAVESAPTADELSALSVNLPLLPQGTSFRRGAGCAQCRETGYLGRTGLFEMLDVGKEMKLQLLSNANSAELAAKARQLGMRTLRESGVLKVAMGITTIEEVLRVT